MLTPKLDTLPTSQLSFWNEEKRMPDHFVLYGGTALALRMGHRQSVDFDFFSSRPFALEELSSAIPFVGQAHILQSQPNTVTLRLGLGDPVIVSFFGNLSFGQLAKPDRIAPHGIKVASLDDLLATKLRAVVQRAEAKDYIDIASLLRAGMSLGRGLGGAVTLFGPNFNAALPLKALTYFGDGDLASVPLEARACLIAAVQQTRRIPKMSKQADRIG